MIEVCDTGLNDDQYWDLLEYLKHDEVLWSDENKNDFYNVATKLAKKWIEKWRSIGWQLCLLHSKRTEDELALITDVLNGGEAKNVFPDFPASHSGSS